MNGEFDLIFIGEQLGGLLNVLESNSKKNLRGFFDHVGKLDVRNLQFYVATYDLIVI